MNETMCLEAYKTVYADIILSKENAMMLKELKHLLNGEDNNFEEVFLKNKNKTAIEYLEENKKRLELGNTILKFFEGDSLTDEEINSLANESAKEKMKALELVSFSKLKDQEPGKLDVFFENDRCLSEMKKGNFEELIDISFVDDYAKELMGLGTALFKYYDGNELTDKELKVISSFDDQTKFDSMTLVAPMILPLKKEQRDTFIVSEKVLNYRIDTKNSKK